MDTIIIGGRKMITNKILVKIIRYLFFSSDFWKKRKNGRIYWEKIYGFRFERIKITPCRQFPHPKSVLRIEAVLKLVDDELLDWGSVPVFHRFLPKKYRIWSQERRENRALICHYYGVYGLYDSLEQLYRINQSYPEIKILNEAQSSIREFIYGCYISVMADYIEKPPITEKEKKMYERYKEIGIELGFREGTKKRMKLQPSPDFTNVDVEEHNYGGN